MTEPSNNTVRLNVGGHIYQISRSTLELYPDTMLASLVAKRWESDSSNDDADGTLFIDRNGVRFQYVLDWMRDGKIQLPVTESYAAVRTELEYFGFDEVPDETIIAGTLEGGNVMTTISGNLYEEVDARAVSIKTKQQEIEDLENEICAMKLAHTLFGRSANVDKGEDRVTAVIKDLDDKLLAFKLSQDKKNADKFFRKRLADKYGLTLVSSPQFASPYVVEEYKYVLDRSKKRQKTQHNEAEAA